jgi:hypothetical protein
MTYTVPKYSRIPGERYQIEIEVKFSDDLTTIYPGTIIYIMEITPLLVQILGGNRQQGYSSPMKVEGLVKDLDVPESQ